MSAPAPTITLQRTQGHGGVHVKNINGISRLGELVQQGAAKVRFPRPVSQSEIEAILINTAGGLTGGDSLSWDINVGANATLGVTTQACEKIYRAESGETSMDITMRIEDHGTLIWAPQETILFDRSRLNRRINAHLSESASLLVCEATIFGRTAFGERSPAVRLIDQWRIFRRSTLVHAEAVDIDSHSNNWLESPAGAYGYRAFATLLLIGKQIDARINDIDAAIQSVKKNETATIAHQSRWSVNACDKMVVRLASKDGYSLRSVLQLLLPKLSGSHKPPHIWNI